MLDLSKTTRDVIQTAIEQDYHGMRDSQAKRYRMHATGRILLSNFRTSLLSSAGSNAVSEVLSMTGNSSACFDFS
jgi:hypothetical protein